MDHFGQRVLPVSLLRITQCPEHGQEHPVEPFNLPIAHWVIRGYVRSTYTTNLLQLIHHVILKLSSLFPFLVDFFREAKLEGKITKNMLYHSICRLISCGVSLGKTSEMVHYYKYVLVTIFALLKVKKVNGYKLESVCGLVVINGALVVL